MMKIDIEALMVVEGITKYQINHDLSLIINQDAAFSSSQLKRLIVGNGGRLPFNIVLVEGNLTLKRMFLTSDEGLPTIIAGNMDISFNKIKRFTCGRTIDGDLIANNNLLEDLEHWPIVGRNVDISSNKLSSLIGMQAVINGDLSVNDNRLKAVTNHKILGSLYASNNILINEPSAEVVGTLIFENNPCNPADDYDTARW